MLGYLDELEDEFNSNDFWLINDAVDEIEKEGKLDIDYWNESIELWYKEAYLNNIKKNGFDYNFGTNVLEAHFVFYCLYKLALNANKALEHAKLAHQFYIKNTLSYQWENIVYQAFKENHSVTPDCILPNNKRPDLVINPTYNKDKYHSRGSKIIRAEKIIDMKTSLYDTTKESKFYKKYCEELIIVYIQDSKNSKDEEITYISADELKSMVSEEKTIKEIEAIQEKVNIDYLINDFNKRLK